MCIEFKFLLFVLQKLFLNLHLVSVSKTEEYIYLVYWPKDDKTQKQANKNLPTKPQFYLYICLE